VTRLVPIAACVVALAGCGGNGDEVAGGQDTKLVTLAHDDPGIAAAKAEAQRRWPEFVESFGSGRALDHQVKAPFDAKGGRVEHLWLAVTAIEGEVVTATILNEPLGDIGYLYGDEATIRRRAVDDWSVWKGDELVKGYFSEDVLTGG
jgi:uncharacterized protein YegJ (DUF2314 family)